MAGDTGQSRPPGERRHRTRLLIPIERHPLTAEAVRVLLERWRERARHVYPPASPELRGVEAILSLGHQHPELFVALGAIAEQISYDEMIV